MEETALQAALERVNTFIKDKGYDFEIAQSDINASWWNFTDEKNRKLYARVREVSGGLLLHFGDFRDSSAKYRFFSEENELSKKDRAALKRAEKEFEAERVEKQIEAKRQVEELCESWRESLTPERAMYLEKKKLPFAPPPAFTRKSPNDNQRILVVPMADEQGVVWNYQQLFLSGVKSYHKNARKKGLHHRIPGSTDVALVGEGYATCLAASLATGFQGYVAFDAGNLERVLELAVTLYGASKVILVADFDGETYQKTGENPGMLAAQKLSLKYKVKVASPVLVDFGLETCGKNLDFADLYKEGGAERVLEALTDGRLVDGPTLAQHRFKKPAAEKPKLKLVGPGDVAEELIPAEKATYTALPETVERAEQTPTIPAGAKLREVGTPKGEIVRVEMKPLKFELPERPLPHVEITFTANRNPVLPPEGDVVEVMLKHFAPYIVKSGGDLFLYNGTYWSQLEDEDYLFQVFHRVLQGKAGYKKLRDMVQMFVRFVPRAPRDMHSPQIGLTAFQNGTLQVHKSRGRWEILFREHRFTDYITNVIPFEFDETLEEKNELFDHVLENILGDDSGTKRALAQMFGACLAPMFPRLFMLIGKPGRGKSTVMILATKLVSESNVSSVLPSDFGGFLAEGMIGKLVNYDTDIPADLPLNDSVLKKVEDRAPIAINRKGRKVVRTCLPPVHLFGANQLPPTFERSVGAYKRRWTFLEFNRFEAAEGQYNKDMVDDVVKAGMKGLINFAVKGLRDLLDADGHYYMKEEAKERLEKWQRDNDAVAVFLDDASHGRLDGLRVAKDGLIKRSDLWKEFCLFVNEVYPNSKSKLSRNKFYQALRDKGIAEKLSNSGYDCFVGYALKSGIQP